MKAVCYLRVARSSRGFLFAATTKASASPLSTGGYNEPLPTRQFKLVLDLPSTALDGIDGTVQVAVPDAALSTVVAVDAAAPDEAESAT